MVYVFLVQKIIFKNTCNISTAFKFLKAKIENSNS